MSIPHRVVPLLALAAALAGLSLLAAGGDPLPGDTAGIELAQRLPLLPVARFFEDPVDEFLLPAAAVAGALFATSRRRFDLAVVLAVTWPSSSLNSLLKLAVERPRPVGDFQILSSPETWSFPSGHAYLAAVVAGAWVLLAAKSPELQLRRVIIAVAASVIVIAGFSRVWLGVHWPSDVLGAWLLAALVLAVAGPLGAFVDMSIQRAGKRLGYPRRLPPPVDIDST